MAICEVAEAAYTGIFVAPLRTGKGIGLPWFPLTVTPPGQVITRLVIGPANTFVPEYQERYIDQNRVFPISVYRFHVIAAASTVHVPPPFAPKLAAVSGTCCQ